MASDQIINDGMVNLVANLGTGRDKLSHTTYTSRVMSTHLLDNIYQNSWVAQSGIDFPAEDATRKWRSWRGESDQITAIEKLEKRLGLQSKLQKALKMARLYGGSAIYINTGASDPSSRLIAGSEIKSLVVLGRHELAASEVVRDISSEYYGSSEYYRLTSVSGNQADIHASRLVILKGVDKLSADRSDPWGNSVLQSAYDSLAQRDSTVANIASLVFESKVDIFRFKGFADMMAANQDDRVLRRMTLQATMKGINGAVVIDTEDEYDQKNSSFGGLPELIAKFQEEVSGAFGIPVTRLFGRSAAGLSGSGDGDERVYYDRIRQSQSLELEPAMALLDECLIHQALSGRPEEVYYDWRPLREISETDRASIFSQTANALRALAGSNTSELIPLDALSDSAVNELTELGVLPGLEAKIAEYGSLHEQTAFTGTDTAITDALPMSLYVFRKVENADEIIKHYRDQGLDELIDPEDMHVTIMYSRRPVDWMKIGESWRPDLEISGGPRITELFGPEKDVLVLAFSCEELKWRHEEMIRAGAGWDWAEYQPHITVAKNYYGRESDIQPWVGAIQLGSEVFERIDEV